MENLGQSVNLAKAKDAWNADLSPVKSPTQGEKLKLNESKMLAEAEQTMLSPPKTNAKTREALEKSPREMTGEEILLGKKPRTVPHIKKKSQQTKDPGALWWARNFSLPNLEFLFQVLNILIHIFNQGVIFTRIGNKTYIILQLFDLSGDLINFSPDKKLFAVQSPGIILIHQTIHATFKS